MLQTILDALMVLIISGTTYFDVHETVRRIGKYGPSIELNPVVRHFWEIGHPKVAVVVGIVLPTAAVTLVPAAFGLAQVVGFVAGAKAFNAFLQWQTRKS